MIGRKTHPSDSYTYPPLQKFWLEKSLFKINVYIVLQKFWDVWLKIKWAEHILKCSVYSPACNSLNGTKTILMHATCQLLHEHVTLTKYMFLEHVLRDMVWYDGWFLWIVNVEAWDDNRTFIDSFIIVYSIGYNATNITLDLNILHCQSWLTLSLLLYSRICYLFRNNAIYSCIVLFGIKNK